MDSQNIKDLVRISAFSTFMLYKFTAKSAHSLASPSDVLIWRRAVIQKQVDASAKVEKDAKVSGGHALEGEGRGGHAVGGQTFLQY
jgi:hypothetical protein